MCNNTTNSPHLQTKPMIKKSKAAARRTRKQKFISLKTELSTGSSGDVSVPRQLQLDLFPLHPENLMEEKEENVDHLLDSGGGATLAGLLNDDQPSEYEYRGQESDLGGGDAIMRRALLVRTAMKRRKDSHVTEEKWVHYSEVVEKKEEEVSSCSAKTTPRSLSLKLDYQEILDAWSDKGSLYIEAQGPQTVPDLRDDDFFGSANNNYGVMDGSGSSTGNLWTVPEHGGKEVCTKTGQREASMLRYKEKRQNRLFSKQIRYEVRKLNAEKRPRMKGRFVKRN